MKEQQQATKKIWGGVKIIFLVAAIVLLALGGRWLSLKEAEKVTVEYVVTNEGELLIKIDGGEIRLDKECSVHELSKALGEKSKEAIELLKQKEFGFSDEEEHWIQIGNDANFRREIFSRVDSKRITVVCNGTYYIENEECDIWNREEPIIFEVDIIFQ